MRVHMTWGAVLATFALVLGCGSDSATQATPDAGPSADAGSDPGAGAGPRVDTGPIDPGPPIVDLVADANRDGDVDIVGSTDDDDGAWDKDRGAVLLANIDDDLVACEPIGADVELPTCNDAADDIINGEDDLADLARLWIRPWPGAPAGVAARVSIADPGGAHVRLFVKRLATNPMAFTPHDPVADVFSVEALQSGVELAIEAKDIVRDKGVWDGFVDLSLAVTDAAGNEIGDDSVRMRVSPVMTMHHRLPAQTIFATRLNYAASLDFRTDLEAAMAKAGVPDPLYNIDMPDQWTQDFLETGYMSMPGPNGEQHVIRVTYRSANVDNPNNPSNPLRFAGRVVFTELRGKDSAGVQEFDIEHEPLMDTLNSFGNTETIPPYSYAGIDYPLGRLYRGSVESYHPDPAFARLLEAQGQQPPVYVDTSWLLVAHVDETISFVRADNARGWTIVANDAAWAAKMLDEATAAGHGAVKMFEGKYWDKDVPADISIDGVLADEGIMGDSAKAAVAVDAQLAILFEATGLTQDDVVPIPFLHYSIYGHSVAYMPGIVNGLVLGDHDFAAPKPYGPVIGGKDILVEATESSLAKVGVDVHWVEDWDLYHRLLGEVHCGSNAARVIPEARWWEAGR